METNIERCQWSWEIFDKQHRERNVITIALLYLCSSGIQLGAALGNGCSKFVGPFLVRETDAYLISYGFEFECGQTDFSDHRRIETERFERSEVLDDVKLHMSSFVLVSYVPTHLIFMGLWMLSTQ